VLASDEFAKKHGIARPVYIAAQTMTTDYPSSFEEHSMIKMVGYDMAKSAAAKVYEQPASAPTTSSSSSSTTASRPTNSSPTRRSACARKAKPRAPARLPRPQGTRRDRGEVCGATADRPGPKRPRCRRRGPQHLSQKGYPDRYDRRVADPAVLPA